MSIVKHIEVTAESPDGFEAAIKEGLKRASATVKGIKSAWVKDQQVLVKGSKVTTYRVNMKVTFELEG